MTRPIQHKELRKFMREHGITQAALADSLGTSRTALCAKINGSRPFTLENMYMIAAALWADPDQVEILFPEIKEKEK